MSAHVHSPGHGPHHGHNHDQAHDHHHHHGHAHAPSVPHPPMVLPLSFMRLSLVVRLGIALLASAMMWGAVWLAMR
jgi:hypothetical protein